MLGVIIGVMSVTLITMISNGFQHYIQYEFKKLGADTLFIAYDGTFGRRADRAANLEGLKMDDVDFLMSRCTTLEMSSAILALGSQKVTYQDKEVGNPDVNAVDHFMPELNKIGLVAGRHISEEDLDARANVAVIGKEIERRLFGEGQGLGKLITFPGITMEVIGVTETVEIMGQSNDRDILVPLTTAQDKWIGGEQITYITASPKAGVTVEQAMDDVWRALMLKSGNKKVFRVDSRESIMNVFGSILGVAGAVLAGIAALSLLVGGIGIMNIMLVSVTERTREVGLRKALGATRPSILAQFLVEATLLSMVGGLIGMFIAWLFGQGVTAATAAAKFPSAGGLVMAFPLESAIISTVISAVIGLIFGLYPAGRASKLSPIEALRTE
jgi:putative ABC transport system permease protein